MTAEAIITVLREALMTAFWVSLPLLAIGFAAGIVISLLQIVTSVQDPGFGGVPRRVGVVRPLLRSGWTALT